MRQKIFAIILWVIMLGLIGYTFYPKPAPCTTPIQYKIGTLDPRFGVSEAEFQKDISQASSIWGSSIGRTLFAYNPNGALTINLVYDTRQQTTQKEQVLTSSIDKNSQVAASVKQQYTSLQNSYQNAEQAYTNQLAQFNQAQDAYNKRVEYWNSQGGAPAADYAALTAQKSNLLAQRSTLEQARLQVNQLADQINALIDKYNLLVAHINANVDTINNDGLSGTQFEEGVYISDQSGERINIYQFDTKTYFIRVIAHELGHALQLGHNNGPDSIMNPVNQSQSLALSADDLQALKTECGL